MSSTIIIIVTFFNFWLLLLFIVWRLSIHFVLWLAFLFIEKFGHNFDIFFRILFDTFNFFSIKFLTIYDLNFFFWGILNMLKTIFLLFLRSSAALPINMTQTAFTFHFFYIQSRTRLTRFSIRIFSLFILRCHR